MDDSEIISIFFKRDERAIEEARRRYGSICRAAAENILGRGEDADECVSDAFLAAWESIPPQRLAALGAYLGKTARNLAINRLRAMRAQKRGGGEAEAVFDEMSTVVHGAPSPEAAAERRELLRAVNGFLASLPPDRRRHVRLPLLVFRQHKRHRPQIRQERELCVRVTEPHPRKTAQISDRKGF